jgi:P protein
MLIGVVILTITTNVHLRLIYKDIKQLFINEPKEMKMLKKNIIVWERAAASISPFSKDAKLVQETLKKKVKILRHELKKKMTKAGVETSLYKSTLEGMLKKCRISDI